MLLLGLPSAWWTSLLTALIAAALAAALMPLLGRRRTRLSAGVHVLITGGSKGLGLELARICASRGCSVTVVARNQRDLDAALQQVQAAAASVGSGGKGGGGAGGAPAKVQALSADTGDLAKLHKVVAEAEAAAGPVDLLICNAGLSIPGLFVEQEMEVFERQMRINYLGTVHTIKAVLPGMLQRRQGRVVVVTSALSVLGFAGYCSYAATKWALRGMADSLRNELRGTGVEVSVAYPPDMDTPGYAAEEESKPELCRAVNKAVGSELFTPHQAAKAMVRGIERGDYHLPSPDLGSNFLVASMTSLSPKRFWLLVHVLLGPLLPIITSLFAWFADRAAHKFNKATPMVAPPAAGSGSSGGSGKDKASV